MNNNTKNKLLNIINQLSIKIYQDRAEENPCGEVVKMGYSVHLAANKNLKFKAGDIVYGKDDAAPKSQPDRPPTFTVLGPWLEEIPYYFGDDSNHYLLYDHIRQVRVRRHEDELAIWVKGYPEWVPPKANSFNNITFPKMRKVMPSMIANDLISVQPMSMPSGKLFSLDSTYGNTNEKTKENKTSETEDPS